MNAPDSRRLPAVLLVGVGVLLLIGTAVAGGWLLLGPGPPANSHAVEQVDDSQCAPDSTAPDGPVLEYEELSQSGRDVFDEARTGDDPATTNERIDDFEYGRPGGAVGRQYVRYEGECYELDAEAGLADLGGLLYGLLLGIVVVVGGGGGLVAVATGAIAYRTEPRLAPAVLALFAGLLLWAVAEVIGVPLSSILLVVAVMAPLAVWYWLTRRGWSRSAASGEED